MELKLPKFEIFSAIFCSKHRFFDLQIIFKVHSCTVLMYTDVQNQLSLTWDEWDIAATSERLGRRPCCLRACTACAGVGRSGRTFVQYRLCTEPVINDGSHLGVGRHVRQIVHHHEHLHHCPQGVEQCQLDGAPLRYSVTLLAKIDMALK